MNDSALERLPAAVRALAGELDMGTLLLRSVSAVLDLTGAQHAAIHLPDPRRPGVGHYVADGTRMVDPAVVRALPPGRGSVRGGAYLSVAMPPVRRAPAGRLWALAPPEGKLSAADQTVVQELARAAAVAVANIEDLHVERRRRAALERTVRGFRAMTELARAMGEGAGLRDISRLVAEQARELAGSRSALLVVVDQRTMRVAGAAGAVDPATVDCRLSLGDELGAQLRHLTRPVHVAPLADRLPPCARERIPGRAALVVPLLFAGQCLGVVMAIDRHDRGPAFDDEDTRLLEDFGASVAGVLHTAMTIREAALHRAIDAAERERARWARELHDETLQDLGALGLLLAAARDAQQAQERDAILRDAAARVDRTAEGLRALVRDLRPVTLERLGIAAALEGLVRDAADSSDLEIRFDNRLGDAPRLAPEVELALYRVAQEALRNVVKHAGRCHVDVVAERRTDEVVLRVRDDGVGFDADAAGEGDGFGLVGMRERVGLLGGSLAIVAQPGGGTGVTAALPADMTARRPRVRGAAFSTAAG